MKKLIIFSIIAVLAVGTIFAKGIQDEYNQMERNLTDSLLQQQPQQIQSELTEQTVPLQQSELQALQQQELSGQITQVQQQTLQQQQQELSEQLSDQTTLRQQRLQQELSEQSVQQQRLQQLLETRENQTVTISGVLKLERGIVAIESRGNTYLVPKLMRYIGFINGLQEGRTVTIEGFLFSRAEQQVLNMQKLIVDGREYDFQRDYNVRERNFEDRPRVERRRNPQN